MTVFGILRRITKGKSFAPIVGAYGKVPRIGDFVSVRASAEPAQSFKTWLANAADWGGRRQLPGWPTVFDRAPLSFVLRPRPGTGSVLLGVIRAITYSVGRRFPLSVFTSL